MLVSRSTEESHLYMHLHPCSCGETDFEWRDHELMQRRGHTFSVYSGGCQSCGRERVFEFALAPEPSPPPPALGGHRPSVIIDPGEFLRTSHTLADTVPADPHALDDDEFHSAYDTLAFALASIEEVLKFIPDGTAAVPADAFRNEAGRSLYEQSPELFTRAALEDACARYRRLLADYDATLTALPVSPKGSKT